MCVAICNYRKCNKNYNYFNNDNNDNDNDDDSDDDYDDNAVAAAADDDDGDDIFMEVNEVKLKTNTINYDFGVWLIKTSLRCL